MIINKAVPIRRVIKWTAGQLVLLTCWSLAAVLMFHYSNAVEWVQIPWLPISLIGTAVAFYVGFKNNSAYDRMWEARKIWGAIVNSSRSWGIYTTSFVTKQFADGQHDDAQLAEAHTRLIHRHIAWTYALRSQLLVNKSWEHASQPGLTGKHARYYQSKFGVGLVDDEFTREELKEFLCNEEFDACLKFQNSATQIIASQSADLQALSAANLIDDFRHVAMQKILSDLYEHQGKAERIKNYPLPRQYANVGSIFVNMFIILLPFGMASEFTKLGEIGIWLSIPFSILVGWVFCMMETVGDYSENPFQGMANDIPMLSLCRTIEIDLREMLRETDIPAPIQAKNGVLM